MLGKLKKVDIREIWKNEASDFTTWLAKEENLALLSEEIGISIQLIETEASVGKFFADILAQEETTNHKIIIENQLEETDHDHLGKIITYGSGFDAHILIWIFKDIREEHRKAIDWLNEKADTSLYIFAIKMEVWQIGNSKPAPKFSIICSPNNWAKAIKQSADKALLSDTNLLQLEFWTDFTSHLEKNSKKLKSRKPRPQNWYDLSIGTSFLHFSCIVSFQSNFIRCDIYIPDNKELFKTLLFHKDEIEKKLNLQLTWEELPDKKASRISCQNDKFDIKNKENYTEIYWWFQEVSEKYFDVFPKYCKEKI